MSVAATTPYRRSKEAIAELETIEAAEREAAQENADGPAAASTTAHNQEYEYNPRLAKRYEDYFEVILGRDDLWDEAEADIVRAIRDFGEDDPDEVIGALYRICRRRGRQIDWLRRECDFGALRPHRRRVRRA
jgi:hypothetical protein